MAHGADAGYVGCTDGLTVRFDAEVGLLFTLTECVLIRVSTCELRLGLL